jgi:hypothetical protein
MSGQKQKGKLELTNQVVFYAVKLVLRLTVVIGFVIMYATHRELIGKFMEQSIYKGITAIHILWLAFMLIMALHLL